MSNRKHLAITPTLVICLDKFGAEVAIQLAARLLLMETGLRQDGLIDKGKRLIAREEAGKVIPGYVRIMTIDWLDWLAKGKDSSAFLHDLDEIKDPAQAEQMTKPLPMDMDRNPKEYDAARETIEKSEEIKAQIQFASRPLQEHDGNSPNELFSLRICVVCAAREPNTAALTSTLLTQIETYYKRIIKGVQVYCYTGGTSVTEHLEARGGVKDDTYNPGSPLPKNERERVVGQGGFLREIEKLPIVETCYLFDSHLANFRLAARGRPSEPDEAVVAVALSIIMMLATNADRAIRRVASRRWSLKNPKADPGLFTSLGVASYSIDHPKLHKLMYSWTLGDFLQRAQPPVAGDPGVNMDAQSLIKAQEMESLIQAETGELLIQIAKDTSFEQLKAIVSQVQIKNWQVDLEPLVTQVSACNPGDYLAVKNQLDPLARRVSVAALLARLQEFQQAYTSLLHEEITRHMNNLLEHDAPLLRTHAFAQATLENFNQQVKNLPSIPVLSNIAQEQSAFVNTLSQDYDRMEGETVSGLQKELHRRPSWQNTLGRVLLIVVLVAIIFPLPFALPVSLAVWGGIGASLWYSLHRTHRSMHRNVLHKALQQLAQKQETLLETLHQEAWKWALVSYTSDFATLANQINTRCKAGGTVAQLRYRLTTLDPDIKDHIIEHFFLDTQVKQKLKSSIQGSEERKALWSQRVTILSHLVKDQFISNDKIEEFLMKQVEDAFQSNSALMAQLVSELLARRDTRRLDEIYQKLSDTAVVFAQTQISHQDDPTIELELFSSHGKEERENINILSLHPQVLMEESIDKLRWTFLRVRAGLHFDAINFSIRSPGSP